MRDAIHSSRIVEPQPDCFQRQGNEKARKQSARSANDAARSDLAEEFPRSFHSSRGFGIELRYFPQGLARMIEKWMGGESMPRALRNHNVWLVVTYLGLIFLMARAYS